MKINTPFFVLEIEWLLFVIALAFVFIPEVKLYLSSFFVCYLFIVFHECSHMLVAAIFGKNIEKFKFSISGVNIKFEQEKYITVTNNSKLKKIENTLIYIAGPLSNMVLAFVFSKNQMICEINIFLAVLNLLPIYPLDGYNIVSIVIDLLDFDEKKERLLNIINDFFIFFLLIVSIYQLIGQMNPSTLIFVIYLYIMKNERKKSIKFNRIWQKISC